jgi:hypothetical protein
MNFAPALLLTPTATITTTETLGVLAIGRPGLGFTSSSIRRCERPIVSRNTSASGVSSTSGAGSSCRPPSVVPQSGRRPQRDHTGESLVITAKSPLGRAGGRNIEGKRRPLNWPTRDSAYIQYLPLCDPCRLRRARSAGPP